MFGSGMLEGSNEMIKNSALLFSEPPEEGGLDLVTNSQGGISSASAVSPGPD